MNRIPKSGLIAVVAIALVVGVGAAGAIAANNILSPGEASQAVIDDAAAQLGVESSELSSALREALKNQVDAAVESGRLTGDQADALKERIDSSEYPLLGHGAFGGHGPGGHGHLGHGGVLGAAATYLGLTEAELRGQLADQTLAEAAKEQGKSVSGLVDAMVAEAEESIDQAVADGKLTKEQADELKAGLEERITALVNGELEHGPGFGRGLGHMGGGHMGGDQGDQMRRHGLFTGPPA